VFAPIVKVGFAPKSTSTVSPPYVALKVIFDVESTSMKELLVVALAAATIVSPHDATRNLRVRKFII
jgi:hypothetical protein